jgi:putative DNA-invertase from lambdoid prophage Rac
MIVQPGDVIVAAKLDRVFRNVYDALTTLRDFQSRHIRFCLLDLTGTTEDEAVAELLLTILAAVAEFERESTAERIRDSKRQMRHEGRYQGGAPPFGWQICPDGKLTEDPAEQRALGLIVKCREAGWSCRVISNWLRKTHSIKLSPSSVLRALKRQGEG